MIQYYYTPGRQASPPQLIYAHNSNRDPLLNLHSISKYASLLRTRSSQRRPRHLHLRLLKLFRLVLRLPCVSSRRRKYRYHSKLWSRLRSRSLYSRLCRQRRGGNLVCQPPLLLYQDRSVLLQPPLWSRWLVALLLISWLPVKPGMVVNFPFLSVVLHACLNRACPSWSYYFDFLGFLIILIILLSQSILTIRLD